MKAIIVSQAVIAFAVTAVLVGNQVDTDGPSYGGLDPSTVQIVDADPPADFAPGRYVWNGTAIVASDSYAASQLAAAKATVTAAIDALGGNQLSANVTITSLGLVNSFAPEWLGLITGAYNAAVANPDFTAAWQAQNGWFTLDATQIVTLYNDGIAYVQAVFTTQRTHETNVAALTTVAAVGAYDYTVNWPSTTI